MPLVSRTALVEFSVERMFDLVGDIEAYPQFLPWCAAAHIESRSAACTIASIGIDFHGLRQGFTTENTGTRPDRIDIQLVSGPFRKLNGGWIFNRLGIDACKVSLTLEYDFSSRLLEKMLGPVFHSIADTMVDAFVKRARDLSTS